MKSAILLAVAAIMLPAQNSATHRFVEGDPSSTVRVVIYEDLECPDCANFREALDNTLLPRFAGAVAFEHRDFPLAKHPWARKAAIASRYFESVSPTLALEFRRTTMTHLQEIPRDNFESHLRSFAKSHGADPEKAVASLNDPLLAEAVEQDYQEGVARGVAHTPTVLVNGEPFIEQFPIEDVIRAIERELATGKNLK